MINLSRWNRLLCSLLVAVSLPGWGSASVPAIGAGADSAEGIGAADFAVRAFTPDRQALVTLSFDDAGQTVYDTAFPILSAKGIPATFYFITQFLDDPWAAQLKDLEDHGWEIGSHSKTHPDLTTLNQAELVEELQQSKASLEAAGLTVTGFAYPYGIGAAKPDVLNEIKRNYSYARSVTTGENTPIIRQYALYAQAANSSTSVATMKGWVDTAIEDKSWLVIVLHNIDDKGDPYSTPPADLLELAHYIKDKVDAGEVRAVTAREGMERNTQAGWQEIEAPQPSMQSELIVTNGYVLWHFSDAIVDYLFDGRQWVSSGPLRYWETKGQSHVITLPSRVALQAIGPDRAVVAFTLSSSDGAASVLGEVLLTRDRPLAELRTSGMQGTPQQLLLAKQTARRFSVDGGSLVTDGWLETGLRTFGAGAQTMFGLDTSVDFVRILTHIQRKVHSEYSDYTWGEFRGGSIGVNEFPFISWIGGIAFDTASLLAEAEAGVPEGGAAGYTGMDASPRTGVTGMILEGGEAVNLLLTPPAPGRYTMAIRHKGFAPADQFGYQIDGGPAVTRKVKDVGFGYENVPWLDLGAGDHTVRLSAVSGTIVLDYVLLIPMSRSAATPAGVEFPDDVARAARNEVFLPVVTDSIR